MARRSKTSPVDDFTRLVALLPWWGCLVLALVSYLVLTAFSGSAPVVGFKPEQLPGLMVQSVFHAFAMVGRFVIPILCIAAAAMSAAGRSRRRQLVATVASSSAPDALNGMSWREFEMLVAEGFRLQGYQVLENAGSGPDGGVDLVLTRNREKYLVQCKQWRAFKVGVDVVRELYGVMAARGVAGGFVVTSGSFTAEATAFAQGLNVQLIDGKKLFALLQQASASMRSQKVARAPDRTSGRAPVQLTHVAAPVQKAVVTPFGSTSNAQVPACPVCAKAMVSRVAKRGVNAGTAFWGCTGYPSCRGTRAG